MLGYCTGLAACAVVWTSAHVDRQTGDIVFRVPDGPFLIASKPHVVWMPGYVVALYGLGLVGVPYSSPSHAVGVNVEDSSMSNRSL